MCLHHLTYALTDKAGPPHVLGGDPARPPGSTIQHTIHKSTVVPRPFSIHADLGFFAAASEIVVGAIHMLEDERE